MLLPFSIITPSLDDQDIWLQRMSPECQDLLPLDMNLMANEVPSFPLGPHNSGNPGYIRFPLQAGEQDGSHLRNLLSMILLCEFSLKMQKR